MDTTKKITEKENISYKEFHQGVPDNLLYETNYLKGLDEDEMKEAVKSILIGLATIVVGAIAVLIPTCLQ